MGVKGVVVLGMHRSGTSVVTRVINLMGVPLGRADDIYNGPDNFSGHWESLALGACNKTILALFGGTEHTLPRLARGWENSPKSSNILPALRASFCDVYRTERWLWKDPRLCITLPLWRRFLPEFCVVFVTRRPGPVSRSLSRREDMPVWYSLANWERYNRAGLQSLTGLPVIVVNFEELMSDPAHEVGRLADDLQALGVDLSAGAAVATSTVRPDIVRERSDASWVDQSFAPFVAAINKLPRSSRAFYPPALPAEPAWVQHAFTVGRLRAALRDGFLGYSSPGTTYAAPDAASTNGRRSKANEQVAGHSAP